MCFITLYCVCVFVVYIQILAIFCKLHVIRHLTGKSVRKFWLVVKKFSNLIRSRSLYEHTRYRKDMLKNIIIIRMYKSLYMPAKSFLYVIYTGNIIVLDTSRIRISVKQKNQIIKNIIFLLHKVHKLQ